MKKEISELAVQYFWFQKGTQQLWMAKDGREINILHPGRWNVYDGPDFYQAQWEDRGICQQGMVEIHVQSSDWMRHGHHQQPQYLAVDMHVVAEDDTDHQYAPTTISLSANGVGIAQILASIQQANVRDMEIFQWERRMSRYQQWVVSFGEYNARWIALSRAMGCHIHGDELEYWAKNIPWEDEGLRQSSLLELTGRFLKRAGFLSGKQPDNAYLMGLLAAGEGVESLNILWKKKCRPNNRALLRVVQLACVYDRCRHLDIRHCAWSELYEILVTIQVPLYWRFHYAVGQTMKELTTSISRSMAEKMIYNAFGHLVVH